MARVADTTVETFQNSGLSEGEARVHALRLDGLSHSEIAQTLDLEVGTVKSYCARIDKKGVSLPHISKVETHARVTPEDDRAVVIWFENGAKLRYRVREHEDGETTVYEEAFRADDPHSVYESFDLALDAEEIEEAALETISEYLNIREDPEAVRKDWPHVFEALTLVSA